MSTMATIMRTMAIMGITGSITRNITNNRG